MYFVVPQTWVTPAITAAALHFGPIGQPVEVKYRALDWGIGTIDRPNVIIVDKRPRWDWSRVKAQCTLVHEYGHLTGNRHSDNPKSVMYPVYRYRVCKRWLIRHGVL